MSLPTSASTTDAPQASGTPVRDPARGKSERAPADPTPHRCRCGSRWGGYRTAHCGACHVTTSGVTAFDAHRRGGVCAKPAEVGMSLVPGRPYECWGFPEVTE